MADNPMPLCGRIPTSRNEEQQRRHSRKLHLITLAAKRNVVQLEILPVKFTCSEAEGLHARCSAPPTVPHAVIWINVANVQTRVLATVQPQRWR